jgi:hypothetical protein
MRNVTPPLQSTFRRTARSLPRSLGAATLSVGLALGVAVPLTLAPTDAARAQQSKPSMAADIPPMPRLAPGLDAEIGIGRTADLVRARVVGLISLIGSLTEGDIIATDGPITATETPDGGARVLFKDLTIRAGASAGVPIVIALGDVSVDAASADDGDGVTYRATVPGPMLIYVDDVPMAELSARSITLAGEINPDHPVLGDDTITVQGFAARAQAPGGDAPNLSIDGIEIESASGLADDGSLEAKMTMALSGVGIAEGEREPTVKMANVTMDATYKDVPGAWVEVLDLLAARDGFVTMPAMVEAVARVMGGHALGYNGGGFEITGLEVFVTPTESLTIDRLGMKGVFDEPADGMASGEGELVMDGLRTRGQSMPVAVDLGALRVGFDGSGLDMGRLRAFMADTLQAVSVLPMKPEDVDQITPEMEAELETRMINGTVGLLRDMAIGEGEMSMSLSGLAVRSPQAPLMGLESMELSGGWAEDDAGLLDTPVKFSLKDLSISDPDLGMPMRIGRLDIDTTTEDLDLASFRTLAAAAVESFAKTDQPPSPALVTEIADGMTMAGGALRIALQDIVLGSEMNPMGGLKAANLALELAPAPPGQEVQDLEVSFSMSKLDAGPMAAMAAPVEIIPTAADLALTLTDLPLPGIMRLGMTTPSDPMAADQIMEQGSMELVMRNKPGVRLAGLTLSAPELSVEGDGTMDMVGPSPDALQGKFALAIKGLDEAMALLQERAKTDPAMQQPMMVLVALRGLGNVSSPGTHTYDIEVSPQEMLINGTPASQMMGPPPTQQ